MARELDVSWASLPRFRSKPGNHRMSICVNWGCRSDFTTLRDVQGRNILNRNINVAVSKRRSFRAFTDANIRCPPFTTNSSNIQALCQRFNATRFLARRDGLSGGDGIQICEADGEIPNADFYTPLLNVHREYRIHVFQGRVLAQQQKIIPNNCHTPIHNYAQGGCTFELSTNTMGLRESRHAEAVDMSIRAVAAVGCDFGAVDLMLVLDSDGNRAMYILEINTAPALRTPTLYDLYKSAFREFVE